MRSSGRDTNAGSQKMKWYHSNFMVEWLKDPNNGDEDLDLIIVNSAASPSEMQASPCYCDIIIPTDT